MPTRPPRDTGVKVTQHIGIVHDEPTPVRVAATVEDGSKVFDIEGWQIAYCVNAVLVVWHVMGRATTAWLPKTRVRPA